MSRLPALRPRKVVGALKRAGFVEHQRQGSHLTLIHPESQRRTTVVIHNRDMKRGMLKGILKQAGLTEDEFRRLL